MISYERPVVIGIDGSPESLAAADWGADEAASRCRPLHLVHGVGWPMAYVPIAPFPVPTDPDHVRDDAKKMLCGVAQRQATRHPLLSLSIRVMDGFGPEALVAGSEDAELLVVGSRSAGRVAGLLFGSVANSVIGHAHCPVAVVKTALTWPRSKGPVVVGVDGSPGSQDVLGQAFDLADRTGTSLIAVHVWSDAPLNLPGTVVPFAVNWDAIESSELRILAEGLAGWAEKFPGVSIQRRLLVDRPGRALVSESADASAVVVGVRGRGGFADLSWGSTSRYVAHHAECPVVVVR